MEESGRDIFQDIQHFPGETMKYQSTNRFFCWKFNKKSPKYTTGMLTINNAMFSALKKQTCEDASLHIHVQWGTWLVTQLVEFVFLKFRCLNTTPFFAHKITERPPVMAGTPVSFYLDFLLHSLPTIWVSRGSSLLFIYKYYFKLCYNLGIDVLR